MKQLSVEYRIIMKHEIQTFREVIQTCLFLGVFIHSKNLHFRYLYIEFACDVQVSSDYSLNPHQTDLWCRIKVSACFTTNAVYCYTWRRFFRSFDLAKPWCVNRRLDDVYFDTFPLTVFINVFVVDLLSSTSQ